MGNAKSTNHATNNKIRKKNHTEGDDWVILPPPKHSMQNVHQQHKSMRNTEDFQQLNNSVQQDSNAIDENLDAETYLGASSNENSNSFTASSEDNHIQRSISFTHSTSMDNSSLNANNIHIGDTYINTWKGLHEINSSEHLLLEKRDFISRKSLILRKQYERKCVCIFPFIKQEISPEKYLNLRFEEMNSKPHSKLDFPQEPVDPDQFGRILKWDTPKGREEKILINGPAWFGKSTFCLQLVNYWSSKKSEILNYFDLVFLIEGKNYKSLRDTLLDQIKEADDDENSRKDAYNILKKMDDKILIIIDGYDQIREECYEEIKELITCRLFTKATVIITSRPQKSKQLSDLPLMHLKITGFCPKQIVNYAKSIFGKDVLNKLLKIFIGRDKDIEECFSCPFLSLLFCHVAENELELQINPSLTKYLQSVFIKATYAQDAPKLIDCGKFCYETNTNSNIKCSKKEFEEFLKTGEMEFFIAVYLVNNIENDNFRELLWSYLGKQQKSDKILRFLIGLAGEKAKIILENLPWAYSQDLLSLLSLMNENFDKDYLSSIISIFPNWMKMVHQEYILIEQPIPDVSLISECSFMPNHIDILLPETSFLKFKLLEILKLANYNLSDIYFEINKTDDSAFVYVNEILQTLKNNLFLQRLIINVLSITDKVIKLLNQLEHPTLKSLVLTVENGNEDSTFFFHHWNCSSLNKRLPKLSSFQFKLKSLKFLPNTIDNLNKCDYLNSLIIKPFRISTSTILSLRTLILEKNTSHLGVILNRDSEDSKDLFPFFDAITKSMLTSLDLRLSALDHKDMNYLLKHVFHSESITTFLLGDCINEKKNSFFTVDLSRITPPNKIWKYLDFSSWRLLKPEKKNVGKIEKLKIYNHVRSDDKSVNLFYLSKLFMIQSLCCNFCADLEYCNSCEELREIKLQLTGEKNSLSLLDVFKNIPNVSILKFKCKSQDLLNLASDSFWCSIPFSCSTVGFYITYVSDKTIQKVLQMMMGIICKNKFKNFIFKITESSDKIWDEYTEEVFTFLLGAFTTKRRLEEVRIIQPSKSYPCFVDHLSFWQMRERKHFEISSSIISENKMEVVIRSPVQP